MPQHIRNWLLDGSSLIGATIALMLLVLVWSYFDSQSLAPSLRFLDPRGQIEVRTYTPSAAHASYTTAHAGVTLWPMSKLDSAQPPLLLANTELPYAP